MIPIIYLYQLWHDKGMYTRDEIVGFPQRLTKMKQ